MTDAERFAELEAKLAEVLGLSPLARELAARRLDDLAARLAEAERNVAGQAKTIADLQALLAEAERALAAERDHCAKHAAVEASLDRKLDAAESREKALLRLVVDLSELIGNCPRCHAAMHPSDVGREAGLGTHLAGCELGAALAAAGKDSP